MATSNATGGLDHPTVVPENYEPDRPDDRDAERDSGADGASADGAATDGSRD